MSYKLLSIVELGGYPSLSPLYERLGFEVEVVHNMRKAMKTLKKFKPDVIVTEFNYQTDFRDRTSSLESLMATLQWEEGTQVIVLYDKEWQVKLENFKKHHTVFGYVPFPIDEKMLTTTLEQAKETIND